AGRNASGIANLAGGSIELLSSPTNQRDFCSMLRESLRDGEIDPAPPTGDDGGFSIEHFLFEYFCHRSPIRIVVENRKPIVRERVLKVAGLIRSIRSEPQTKKPRILSDTGLLLVAHPSYKLSQ
ncbi:MAG TPA: hypothetical protein VGO33_01655, partial [Gemmatimonadaceae bacterium]|nr:hypothetical protein [Gemmatimonadaceae bacterium]